MKFLYFNDELRFWFFFMGYDIFDMIKVISFSKCVMIVFVLYFDSVNVGVIEIMCILLFRVWEFEYMVFSYLLYF